MTEVRYVETDLPPVMVGLVVHVIYDGRCTAALITDLRYGGEVTVEHFIRPGGGTPTSRDQTYRFEPGGSNYGTYHRLMECPQLSQMASMTGTWPVAAGR